MKDKKSFGYKVGYVLGCTLAVCAAAIVASLLIVPTIKIVMWLFAFI